MEKITLKPVAREILVKSKEPDAHFDVLSYHGTSVQERSLGSLFVLGHLKQKGDELGYMVSLISSLAKREYYSPQALSVQSPKIAFERTLKKLNEVLEEFFTKKNFNLNLGLTAIAGENIYISRLGKLKVALARDKEYIDILNNIELFNKDDAGEKQFSNIISGKIRAGDKIFAYFPTRPITSRERMLNPLFVSQNQEEFSQKIAHLAANVKDFACCGVHINIEEIKEIPVVPVPVPVPRLPDVEPSPPPTLSGRDSWDGGPKAGATSGTGTVNIGTGTLGTGKGLSSEVAQPIHLPTLLRRALAPSAKKSDLGTVPKAEGVKDKFNFGTGATNAMRAEVSVAKRDNVFTGLAGKLRQGVTVRKFIATAILVIAGLGGWAFVRNTGSPETRTVLSDAAESFKLARSRIDQNDLAGARSLLQAALGQVAALDSKKAESLSSGISAALDTIDQVNVSKQPTLIYNANGQQLGLKKLTGLDGTIEVIDAKGALFALLAESSGLAELGQFKIVTSFAFDEKNYVASFDGSKSLAVYDFKTKKIESRQLSGGAQADGAEATDSAVYENNLYTLAGTTVYKYPDAISGNSRGSIWATDNESGNLISLAVDGNVFALTKEGKMIKYFKGKKEGEFNLQLTPSAGSRIFTSKDSPFIYLSDREVQKVYVFDKSNGQLKASYKFSVVGKIQDVSVGTDGTITALSETNNIWQVKP